MSALLSDLKFVVSVHGHVHPKANVTLARRTIDEITRLRRVNAELVERLRELADAAERDLKLNQGGDDHEGEPESSGGWWSTKTENAIREARAALRSATEKGEPT